MIRFFCQADDSELGKFALSWIPFLQALDLPIRIAAAGANLQTGHDGRSHNPWAKYASMFATALGDSYYANVVALPSSDWARRPAVIRPKCASNLLLVCDADLDDDAKLGPWLNNHIVVCPSAASALTFQRAVELKKATPRSVVALAPKADNLVAFRVLTGL